MQLKIQNGHDDDDDCSDGNMKIFILLLIIKRASAFCEKFWLYLANSFVQYLAIYKH